jgi:hypothetical protein
MTCEIYRRCGDYCDMKSRVSMGNSYDVGLTKGYREGICCTLVLSKDMHICTACACACACAYMCACTCDMCMCMCMCNMCMCSHCTREWTRCDARGGQSWVMGDIMVSSSRQSPSGKWVRVCARRVGGKVGGSFGSQSPTKMWAVMRGTRARLFASAAE